MTKTTEEYMIWFSNNTGKWEELLSGEVPLGEALEYYELEIQGSYDVKVTSGGEDVTEYFEELLWTEDEDYSEGVYEEESSYDFQYREARAAGHFS